MTPYREHIHSSMTRLAYRISSTHVPGTRCRNKDADTTRCTTPNAYPDSSSIGVILNCAPIITQVRAEQNERNGVSKHNRSCRIPILQEAITDAVSVVTSGTNGLPPRMPTTGAVLDVVVVSPPFARIPVACSRYGMPSDAHWTLQCKPSTDVREQRK